MAKPTRETAEHGGAAMSSSRKKRVARAVAYSVPLCLIGLLLLIYLLWPGFYLDYVIQEERRERQAVELITVFSALVGSVLMFIAAWRLWQSSPANRPTGMRGGAVVIAVIALATFFLAGEESSWGQTYFGWQTPEQYKEISRSGETNLHNTFLKVQTLGSLFLLVMFFALPVALTRRASMKLPPGWAPAIADGPVIFCMAVAFLWKTAKSLYVRFLLTVPRDEDPFYTDFIDQINEHKEMLVAVALLMYGLFRLTAVNRALAAPVSCK